jgi:hypothetical protein
MSNAIHPQRYAPQPGILRPGEEPLKCEASWTAIDRDPARPGTLPATADPVISVEEDPERWDGLS